MSAERNARRDDPRLFDTAYHEAGHVIASLALNLRFDKVIAVHAPEAGRENHGAVVRAEPIKVHGEHAELGALIQVIAGPMAEALFNKQSNSPHRISRWYAGEDE